MKFSIFKQQTKDLPKDLLIFKGRNLLHIKECLSKDEIKYFKKICSVRKWGNKLILNIECDKLDSPITLKDILKIEGKKNIDNAIIVSEDYSGFELVPYESFVHNDKYLIFYK